MVHVCSMSGQKGERGALSLSMPSVALTLLIAGARLRKLASHVAQKIRATLTLNLQHVGGIRDPKYATKCCKS
jgi:hypothetical protein